MKQAYKLDAASVKVMKAEFIGKYYGTGYERHMVYLEYVYRGHTYTVYENRAKGNEPLAWQHKSEQARIDAIIEHEKRNDDHDAQPFDMDEIFRILGWDE